MPCLVIVMADDKNHAFDKDDVIDVLPYDSHVGSKVHNNPLFKIIKLPDTDQQEAEALLEPERDVLMEVVKQRAKKLSVDDLSASVKVGAEPTIDRASLIQRTITKPVKIIEQPAEVVVG